jgi:PAS domain S-box-containing protein
MTPINHRRGTLAANRYFRLEIALLATGIVMAVFGLLALLGWGFGWPLLASFGASRIPMPPDTAGLFLAQGAAMCLRARTPLSRRAQWGSGALVGVSTLFALLLFALSWLRIEWAGEHLGLNITGTVGGAPIGHMSPVTALCFLLAGGSFLASLSPSAIPRWRATLALVSAVVLLGICFVFLLAYSFGTPLLYGGQFIPPALNTILAFLALGLALAVLPRRPDGLLRGSPEDHSSPPLRFLLIFLVLAMGIVTWSYAYYRIVERQYRAEVQQHLAAIGDLKVGELVAYRKERLADAAILYHNTTLTRLVRRSLASPVDAEVQQQLQEWLGQYEAHFQYDQIRLLDAQGVTRLSLPTSLLPISSAVARGASEALRTGQMIFQDFYRNEYDQLVYMAILVPVRDETDGNRPLGVLVLRINPASFLYPFISRWPVPSATAETLLVRREGNEVVYLNELRFQQGTTLNLRFPLTNTNVPAVKAALGHKGFTEGRDYRDVPVLADLRAVPDSPWFMVARRDEAEVYAPLRAQLWQMLALVGVLLFGAGAGVVLTWRQQHVRIYRERAEVGAALRASQTMLESITQSTSDAIYLKDTQGRYLVFNKAASRNVGMPSEAVLGKDDTALFPPEQAREIMTGDRRVMASGGTHTYEELVTTKAGQTTFLTTKGLVRDAQGEIIGLFGIARDITERKQAEELLRTSREELLLATEGAKLGIWNWNIVKGELIWSDRCKALFGIRPDEAMSYQRFLDILHPDDREKVDMAAMDALANHKDFDTEYRSLWPDGSLHWLEAKGRGYYDATGRATRMQGVVLDITSRKQLEIERQKFFLLAESSSEFIGMCDLDLQPLYVNPAGQRLVGLPDMAAACRVKVPDYYFPEDQQFIAEEFFPRVLRDGHGYVEIRLRHFQTGEPIWMFYYLFSIKDASGTPVGWATISRDITERRQADEALRQSRQAALNLMADAVEARDLAEQASQALRASEQSYTRLFSEMQNGFAHSEIICDARGRPVNSRYLAVNPAFERITGRPAAAVVGKTILEVFPTLDPGWLEAFGRVALTGEPAKFEMRVAELGITFDVAAFRPAPNQYAYTFSDITARKRAEEKLTRMSQLLKNSQEIAHLGSYEYIAATQATIWSEEEYRIYGLNADGPAPDYNVMLGRCIHPDDAQLLHDTFTAAMQNQGVYELEHRIVRPDGSVRWVYDRAHPILDEHGNLVRYAGATLDITEKKRANEQLERLSVELELKVELRTAQLESANRELEAFSYSVSHDLRAPLRSINGFSRILLEDYAAKLDEEGRDSLNRISAAAQRMALLIDDILNLSRLTRAPMHLQSVDLSAVAREVADELRRIEADRVVEIVIADDVVAIADQNLIRAIFENLLGNAWKFTGRCKQPHIEFGTIKQDGQTVYFVRDNGAGFEAAFAGKLFGAFQRLHSTTDFPGTGIGLASVKRIVNRHGGRVWAEGKVDFGATIYFTLAAQA